MGRDWRDSRERYSVFQDFSLFFFNFFGVGHVPTMSSSCLLFKEKKKKKLLGHAQSCPMRLSCPVRVGHRQDNPIAVLMIFRFYVIK